MKEEEYNRICQMLTALGESHDINIVSPELTIRNEGRYLDKSTRLWFREGEGKYGIVISNDEVSVWVDFGEKELPNPPHGYHWTTVRVVRDMINDILANVIGSEYLLVRDSPLVHVSILTPITAFVVDGGEEFTDILVTELEFEKVQKNYANLGIMVDEEDAKILYTAYLTDAWDSVPEYLHCEAKKIREVE